MFDLTVDWALQPLVEDESQRTVAGFWGKEQVVS